MNPPTPGRTIVRCTLSTLILLLLSGCSPAGQPSPTGAAPANATVPATATATTAVPTATPASPSTPAAAATGPEFDNRFASGRLPDGFLDRTKAMAAIDAAFVKAFPLIARGPTGQQLLLGDAGALSGPVTTKNAVPGFARTLTKIKLLDEGATVGGVEVVVASGVLNGQPATGYALARKGRLVTLTCVGFSETELAGFAQAIVWK